jgi:hypothetical protein
MKRIVLILPVLASTMLFSGCVSWIVEAAIRSGHGTRCAPSSSCSSFSSGGIDPVTMAGIEASNRANDEAVQRASQMAIDQANAASAQAAMDAANAANAAAAAAAAAAAQNQ